MSNTSEKTVEMILLIEIIIIIEKTLFFEIRKINRSRMFIRKFKYAK